MNDIISIEDCVFRTRVGLTEEERGEFREVVVTLRMHVDTSKAAETDNISDTVNYAEVFSAVKWLLEKRTFVLLETLAESIAHAVLSAFDVEKVFVRVSKVRPNDITGNASVEIVRPVSG